MRRDHSDWHELFDPITPHSTLTKAPFQFRLSRLVDNCRRVILAHSDPQYHFFIYK